MKKRIQAFINYGVGLLIFSTTSLACLGGTAAAVSCPTWHWTTYKAYNETAGVTFCATDSQSGNTITWQANGNLVIFHTYANGSKVGLWDSHTNNIGKTLSLQTDGNIVIYDVNHTAIWSNDAYKYTQKGKTEDFVISLTNGSVCQIDSLGVSGSPQPGCAWYEEFPITRG